jgi:hypothetical protein
MINIHKSISAFVFRVVLFSLFMVFSTSQAQALDACGGVQSGMRVMLPQYTDGMTHTVSIDMSSDYNPDREWRIKVLNGDNNWDPEADSPWFEFDVNGTVSGNHGDISVNNGVVTWTIERREALESAGLSGENDNHTVRLYQKVDWGRDDLCNLGTYQTTKNNAQGLCSIYVSQERNGDTCYSSGCMDTSTSRIQVDVEGLEDADGNPYEERVRFVFGQKGVGGAVDKTEDATNGRASSSFSADDETTYTLRVEESRAGNNFDFPGCETEIELVNYCEHCDQIRTNVSDNIIIRDFELCEQIVNPDERGECTTCFSGSGSGGDGGVWTAIGCIPAKPENIIKTLITVGLSLGGGIAFLLILTGAFRMSISQGDPQATKEAKEQITAALTGLMFIIFSITMLRFIGVTLFQIPGFGE